MFRSCHLVTSFLITFALAGASVASFAATPASILVDMETGSSGTEFTAAVAGQCSKGAIGTDSGTIGHWVSGPTSPPSKLTIATNLQPPPLDSILIAGTTYSTTGTRVLRKQLRQQEYQTFKFNTAQPVVSVGFYIYFSSEGTGWRPGLNEFRDFFGIESGNTYNVLSVIEGGAHTTAATPLLLQVHTDNQTPRTSPLFPADGSKGCNSGTPIALAPQNKWIWVAMLYDVPHNDAQMQFFDPANAWTQIGMSGQCALVSSYSPLANAEFIYLGQSDNHGTPETNTTLYYDSLIIDVSANARANFPLRPASGGVNLSPGAPSALQVAP